VTVGGREIECAHAISIHFRHPNTYPLLHTPPLNNLSITESVMRWTLGFFLENRTPTNGSPHTHPVGVAEEGELEGEGGGAVGGVGDGDGERQERGAGGHGDDPRRGHHWGEGDEAAPALLTKGG